MQCLENISLWKGDFCGVFLRKYVFWTFIVFNNSNTLQQRDYAGCFQKPRAFWGAQETACWYRRPWRTASVLIGNYRVKPSGFFSSRNLRGLSCELEDTAGCCWRKEPSPQLLLSSSRRAGRPGPPLAASAVDSSSPRSRHWRDDFWPRQKLLYASRQSVSYSKWCLWRGQDLYAATLGPTGTLAGAYIISFIKWRYRDTTLH